MNGRVIKLLFSCAVGLYASLICFNNVFDYGPNFQFVSMVAKMEDTFSKDKNSWRLINSSFWHAVFFISIVACEITIAVCLWLGSFKMINKLRASATEFKNAKKCTSFGLSLGVLLWFVVFISIGGEWFLMWQSKTWNVQPTAFFLTCSFLLFLIHHNQDDV